MEGWRTQKLSEVFKLEYGKPLPPERRSDDGEFPAYGANGVKCRTNDAYWHRPSIVVGRKGSAGEVNLVDGRFWPLDVTYFVVFDERQHDLKFLYYLLSRLNLPSLAKGVKPGLNRNDVYAIEQRFPPLPEQKRMVAILDEAFAAIATATANAEKNLANARELFESQLDARLSKNVAGWERTCPLSELLSVQPRNGWSPPRKYQTGSGFPVLTLSAVTGFEYHGYNVTLSSAPVRQDAHYWLRAGELLITRSNTPRLVGHVAIYDGSPKKAICPDLIMKMTINSAIAETRFVYYWLRTTEIRTHITSRAVGASSTMKKIGKKVVQGIPVPLLSLPEQVSVVAALDSLSPQTRRLEFVCQRRIQALDDLKQSILHKALTGELTADSGAAGRALSEANV